MPDHVDHCAQLRAGNARAGMVADDQAPEVRPVGEAHGQAGGGAHVAHEFAVDRRDAAQRAVGEIERGRVLEPPPGQQQYRHVVGIRHRPDTLEHVLAPRLRRNIGRRVVVAEPGLEVPRMEFRDHRSIAMPAESIHHHPVEAGDRAQAAAGEGAEFRLAAGALEALQHRLHQRQRRLLPKVDSRRFNIDADPVAGVKTVQMQHATGRRALALRHVAPHRSKRDALVCLERGDRLERSRPDDRREVRSEHGGRGAPEDVGEVGAAMRHPKVLRAGRNHGAMRLRGAREVDRLALALLRIQPGGRLAKRRPRRHGHLAPTIRAATVCVRTTCAWTIRIRTVPGRAIRWPSAGWICAARPASIQ